jgi:hypothetical protein
LDNNDNAQDSDKTSGEQAIYNLYTSSKKDRQNMEYPFEFEQDSQYPNIYKLKVYNYDEYVNYGVKEINSILKTY